jgi:hypothetical protein
LRHAVTVFGDGGHHEMLGCPAAQPHMPRGDHETRGQPFQVPFERTGRDFVEVIQIEYELPLGRGETAEIHQVAVAADRHGET